MFTWVFINSFGINRYSKLLVFALVALNPDFIGINSQATNDTFVILFGTMSVYLLWKYLKTKSFISALLLALCTALAVISKGSGLVVFVAVIICLSARLIVTFRQRRKTFYYSIAFLLISSFTTVSILYFSPYYEYFQKYGTFIVINRQKAQPPYLFKNTFPERPGITSVVSGYFTFHFIDLLKTPYVTNFGEYSLHRTSLLSQLYGRAFSVHFARWPEGWVNLDIGVINLTRTIFILGLLPFAILVTGIIESLTKIVGKFVGDNAKEKNVDWIFSVVFILFIAMIVIYTYRYRDFSLMKTIFLYPAMLSFVYFLMVGLESFKKLLRNHISLLKIGVGCWIVFLFLEVMDVLILINQL
jgi:hypothetical protein